MNFNDVINRVVPIVVRLSDDPETAVRQVVAEQISGLSEHLFAQVSFFLSLSYPS
jgi:hypothetical protein